MYETIVDEICFDDSLDPGSRFVLPTWAVLASEDAWVDRLSARLNLPSGRIRTIRGSHTSIVKPQHKDDDAYVFVTQCIRSALAYCRTELSTGERDQTRKSQRHETLQAIDPASIVVLPFLTLTHEEQDEALSDGITEAVITSLAQIQDLRVIASWSSFALRNAKEDVRDIGARLRVRTILEGSFQRHGDNIRVTAALVEAETRLHLWSQTYDKPFADIFAIQDDIAKSITVALQRNTVLLPNKSANFKPHLGAYEAYLMGRHQMLKHTPESLERSERFLKDAANLDAAYADPRVALGRIYLMRAIEGIKPPTDMLPRVVEQAQEALRIDESDPRAHTLLAISAIALDFDWHLAAKHFSRAFERTPIVPETRQSFSVYLAAGGKYDRAARMLQKALEDDPLNAFWRGRLANHLNLAEDFDRALVEADKTLTIDEHYWLPHYVIAENHVLRQNFDAALQPASVAYKLATRNPRVAGMFAGILDQLGFKERAHAILGDLTPGSSVGMLFYYFVLRDDEHAVDTLLKSISEHQLFAVLYAQSPFTRELRLSKEWSRVVQRMKLRDLADAPVRCDDD